MNPPEGVHSGVVLPDLNGEGDAPTRQRKKTRERRRLAPYVFVGPSFIGVLAFMFIPVVMAGVISFTNWNLLSTPTFVGLANYTRLFGDTRSLLDFGRSGLFTLYTVPLQTVLALLIALLVKRSFRGRSFFRAVFIIPWLATPVVLAVIWRFILDPVTGPVAQLLSLFGISSSSWLQSPTLALPALALITVWQFAGYNSLFFMAGLQTIPDYLYESAMLDGATAWQRFWKITLPLLRPTTLFVVVTSVIGGFQAFDFIYVLTQGGPGHSTEVVNYRIYDLAFNQFQAGYASAISMILFLIILTVTIVQLAVMRNRIVYDLS